jgi:hypothetical protein
MAEIFVGEKPVVVSNPGSSLESRRGTTTFARRLSMDSSSIPTLVHICQTDIISRNASDGVSIGGRDVAK